MDKPIKLCPVYFSYVYRLWLNFWWLIDSPNYSHAFCPPLKVLNSSAGSSTSSRFRFRASMLTGGTITLPATATYSQNERGKNVYEKRLEIWFESVVTGKGRWCHIEWLPRNNMESINPLTYCFEAFFRYRRQRLFLSWSRSLKIAGSKRECF